MSSELLSSELLIDWELARVAPGAAENPRALVALGAEFRAAVVPGTVPEANDADVWDHWYRCRFRAAAAAARGRLCFDGLATLAEVWLNDRSILTSDNMFLAHAVDVSLAEENELYIRFRALLPVLHERRPRGRFPTRLVSEKNLRFVRTTMLGYMPGSAPPMRPVGPWRAVRFVAGDAVSIAAAHLLPRLEGTTGVLEATIRCRVPPGVTATLEGGGASLLRPEKVSAALEGGGAPLLRPANVSATLEGGGLRVPLEVSTAIEGGGTRDELVLRGVLSIPDVELWWPHTHGEPALYPITLELNTGERFELGRVGFRALERVSNSQHNFALRINGETLFARGACWTPLDLTTLHASETQYRQALELVRECGMNMLRVSGSMVYESDLFYQLCDELGIMIWQDFMFARMDYPTDDPIFLKSCEKEAEQILHRLSARPSLVLLCGNSEVAQQAAMMGMSNEASKHVLFDEILPAATSRITPDVIYISSTPSGGVMPFYTGNGPTHYFGVGAYLRSLDDARLHRVAFAAECLAFSNIPEETSLPAHHARYKDRVPRDGGAGWDFADITDHYVEELFETDVRRVRYADHDRYLALCRATTCELVSRVQGFWRAEGSGCRGALIWFLRDLWDGAGWGVVDARGAPKSTYFGLKRAWAPVALWIVDQGLDGLAIHAENDRPSPLEVVLELELYRADGAIVEHARTPVTLGAREQRAHSVEQLIGRFVDSSYAYRFGPPAHVLVAARLLGGDGHPLAQAFHLPLGHGHLAREDQALGLTATAALENDGSYLLTAAAEHFAHFVVIDAPGYLPSDNYFHLAPRVPWRVRLRPLADPRPPLRGKLRALNSTKLVPIVMKE